MSKQLTFSATVSVLTMALFAISVGGPALGGKVARGVDTPIIVSAVLR